MHLSVLGGWGVVCGADGMQTCNEGNWPSNNTI